MAKIALSASFFKCPPVAEILAGCAVVFTSNRRAIEQINHPDKRPLSKLNRKDFPGAEFVEFPALFRVFNLWAAFTATDSELGMWLYYFDARTPDAARVKALGSIPRGLPIESASVVGGWQSRDKETGAFFGPVFNAATELWKWQGENLPQKRLTTT